MNRKFGLVVLCFALGISIHSQAQTPGQIRPRPAEGRQPEWPPPNIREYKPRSTLVVPQHPVPRAKFPVIDIRSHQPTPISPEQYAEVVKAMDQLNIRLIVNLSGSWGDNLRRGLAVIKSSPYPDRMVLFANIDFSDVGPGFGQRAARQLEEDIKAGAVGLKIFKGRGQHAHSSSSTRTEFFLGKTASNPTSTRITGERSKPQMSTLITTGTITPFGSCTASICPTTFSKNSITRTH